MDENRHPGSLSHTDSVPLVPIPDQTVPQAESHYPVELYRHKPLVRQEKKLPSYVAAALIVYAFFVLGISGTWRSGVKGVSIAVERSSEEVLRYAALSGERIHLAAFHTILDLETQSASIFDVVTDFLRSLRNMLTSFFTLIQRNWGSFISGDTNAGALSPLDREALKVELREELLRELSASSTSALPNTPTSRQGVVVTQSSGNAETDAVTVRNIQQAFSDTVTVKMDESGKSGIITPVFLSGKVQSYLYIMVPLEK